MGFPLGKKVLLANFLELRQGGLRRSHLPRTRVNKGIKKGRGHEVPRGPTPAPSFTSYNCELVDLV